MTWTYPDAMTLLAHYGPHGLTDDTLAALEARVASQHADPLARERAMRALFDGVQPDPGDSHPLMVLARRAGLVGSNTYGSRILAAITSDPAAVRLDLAASHGALVRDAGAEVYTPRETPVLYRHGREGGQRLGRVVRGGELEPDGRERVLLELDRGGFQDNLLFRAALGLVGVSTGLDPQHTTGERSGSTITVSGVGAEVSLTRNGEQAMRRCVATLVPALTAAQREAARRETLTRAEWVGGPTQRTTFAGAGFTHVR